jgi:UDPglucose--hexose-1-phosphate uridylyltransferase
LSLDYPHRRFNPLRREWVLVSPHRNDRPWQGQVEPVKADQTVRYDPACYLCPGNVRANGAVNPAYASTFAFDNDYAALRADGPGSLDWSAELPADGPGSHGTGEPTPAAGQPGLFIIRPARGLCRVVCFSPRHDLTLARMDAPSIRGVVETWIGECASIAARPWVRYAMIFENRGAMMGASNPHPHGQIWATDDVPNEPARELESFQRHEREHGSCLLCDYAALEMNRGERIVCANDAFLVVVPFWATWPFETLLVSRRHVASLSALDGAERDALADVLKRLTTRYDNLFVSPFPYSMGFHQHLLRDTTSAASHLHAHFYPPLLRSASIRKFMVGFELLGSPQRDFTPEQAAERLQEVGEIHYTAREGAAASS